MFSKIINIIFIFVIMSLMACKASGSTKSTYTAMSCLPQNYHYGDSYPYRFGTDIEGSFIISDSSNGQTIKIVCPIPRMKPSHSINQVKVAFYTPSAMPNSSADCTVYANKAASGENYELKTVAQSKSPVTFDKGKDHSYILELDHDNNEEADDSSYTVACQIKIADSGKVYVAGFNVKENS